MAGWLTLLYFSHPLTYLVAGLVLGLMVLERALVLTASGRRTWSGARLVDGLGSLALACFPTLPLLIWHLWHQQPEADAPTVAADLNTWQRLNDWLLLEPLRFMGSAEATYRLILAVLLGGLLGYAGWQHLRRQAVAVAGAWAVAIIGLAVAYIWMPDAIAGGSIVRPRLALCSYLLVLGLLSTVPYPRRLQQFILGVGGLLAVLLLGFRYSHYRTLATGIDEYRSAAPYLRPGATLAALTYGNVTHMPNGKTYDSYINPFPHAAGYLSVERYLFNFENYEAQTGYFPLVWRPGAALLTDTQGAPAVFDLAAYPLVRWPDYVLLWGRTTQTVPTANAQVVAAQLARAH